MYIVNVVNHFAYSTESVDESCVPFFASAIIGAVSIVRKFYAAPSSKVDYYYLAATRNIVPRNNGCSTF